MYIDKRLVGTQAVQTLSRLNWAYPGKDTTYVLGYVRNQAEILTDFKTYQTMAKLPGVTDSKLIFDLKAKPDASGYFDSFEVNRVAAVELNPDARQSDLVAALEPVADRLVKRFQVAKTKLSTATAADD